MSQLLIDRPPQQQIFEERPQEDAGSQILIPLELQNARPGVMHQPVAALLTGAVEPQPGFLDSARQGPNVAPVLQQPQPVPVQNMPPRSENVAQAQLAPQEQAPANAALADSLVNARKESTLSNLSQDVRTALVTTATELLRIYKLSDDPATVLLGRLSTDDFWKAAETLRALDHPATTDEVKAAFTPVLRQCLARALVKDELDGMALHYGLKDGVGSQACERMLQAKPGLLQSLCECKNTAEVMRTLTEYENMNALTQAASTEAYAACVTKRPDDLPEEFRAVVPGVLDAVRRNFPDFKGVGLKDLSPACRSDLASRIRDNQKVLTEERFSGMLRAALEKDLREGMLMDALKERYRLVTVDDSGQTQPLWRDLAAGVKALAKGDEALNALDSATTATAAKDAITALDDPIRQAIDVAVQTRQAAEAAQATLYAGLSERTGLPVWQLASLDYPALKISDRFGKLQRAFARGEKPPQDFAKAFEDEVGTILRNRVQLLDDIDKAYAEGKVDAYTKGLWQQRAIADETLPLGMPFASIAAACDSLDADALVQSMKNGNADAVVSALRQIMADLRQNMDIPLQDPEQTSHIQRAAAEYLLQKHGLYADCAKEAFITALEESAGNVDTEAMDPAERENAVLGQNLAVRLAAALDRKANDNLANDLRSGVPDGLQPFYDTLREVAEDVEREFGTCAATKSANLAELFNDTHLLDAFSNKIGSLDGKLTQETFRSLARDTLLEYERDAVLRDGLRDRMKDLKLDTEKRTPGFWNALCHGVKEMLARGDSLSQSLLAELTSARTRDEAVQAVNVMSMMQHTVIARNQEIEQALTGEQEKLYATLKEKGGLSDEEVRGHAYRQWDLTRDFSDIKTAILSGVRPLQDVTAAFSAKAQRLLDRHMSLLDSVDSLGLPTEMAARWKKEALGAETPKMSFTDIYQAARDADVHALEESVAAYHEKREGDGTEEELKELAETVLEKLGAAAAGMRDKLVAAKVWPEDLGPDDEVMFSRYATDVLLLLHPDLRETLQSSSTGLAERLFGASVQLNDRLGVLFVHALYTHASRMHEERDAQAQQCVAEAQGRILDSLAAELAIPRHILEQHVKLDGLNAELEELQAKIRDGRLPARGEAEQFSVQGAFDELIQQHVRLRVEALGQVDAMDTVPQEGRLPLKEYLLGLPTAVLRNLPPLAAIGSMADAASQSFAALEKAIRAHLDLPEPVSRMERNLAAQEVLRQWSAVLHDMTGAWHGEGDWADLDDPTREAVLSLAWLTLQSKAHDEGNIRNLPAYVDSMADPHEQGLPEEHIAFMQSIRNNDSLQPCGSVNAGLSEAIDKGDMPAMHAQVFMQTVSDLRQEFGENALPTDMQALLASRLPGSDGVDLRQHLKTGINNATKANQVVTPQRMAALAKEILLPIAMEYAAWNHLRQFAENADPPVNLTTEALQTAWSILVRDFPSLRPHIQQLSSLEELRGYMNDLPHAWGESLTRNAAKLSVRAGHAHTSNKHLLEGLKNGSLPIDYAKAIEDVSKYMRFNTGENDVLPADAASLLNVQLPGEPVRTLGAALEDFIAGNSGIGSQQEMENAVAITPHMLNNKVMELLRPIARQHVQISSLRQLAMGWKPPVRLTQEDAALTLTALHTQHPDMMREIDTDLRRPDIDPMLTTENLPGLEAIVRHAQTISASWNSAMAELNTLATDAGLAGSEIKIALDAAGLKPETILESGYLKLLQPGKPLPGIEDVRKWCDAQLHAALDERFDALENVRRNNLLSMPDKKALAMRILSHNEHPTGVNGKNPFLLGVALDTIHRMTLWDLFTEQRMRTPESATEAYNAAYKRMSDTLDQRLQQRNIQIGEEEKALLLGEVMDLFLATHPHLLGLIALSVNSVEYADRNETGRIVREVDQPLAQRGNSAAYKGRLPFLNAARARLAQRWMFPEDQVQAFRSGSATEGQEQALNILAEQGEAELAAQLARLEAAQRPLAASKASLLRNAIAHLYTHSWVDVQNSHAEDKDAAWEARKKVIQAQISLYADQLCQWEDVPLNSPLNDPGTPVNVALLQQMRDYMVSERFNDSMYDANGLHSGVVKDADRGSYVINGQPMSHPKPEDLSRAIEDAVPDPRMRRYLSALLFQSVFSLHIGNSYGNTINGRSIQDDPEMKDAQKLVRGYTDPDTEIPILPLTSGAHDGLENIYELEIAPDRSSAIVRLTKDFGVNPFSLEKLSGRCRVTQEMHIQLKGGTPLITKLSIGQQLTPMV